MIAAIQPLSICSFNDLERGGICLVTADEHRFAEHMALHSTEQDAGGTFTPAGGMVS